ncbi:hypothetical protein LT875_002493 [Salmonella enterica]|nr:hypothetical protein [Salmonella enterica]
MHLNYIGLYIACAVAWTVIETQLSIQRMENDQNHWLQRAMKRCRKWADRQYPPISVGGRILACFFLAIAAWIPVLLVSACWPVTVTIYVLCNFRDKD